MFVLLMLVGPFAYADTMFVAPPAVTSQAITSPTALQTISDQFSTSFLSHVLAVDSFRSDGSHVIKFADGIIQAVPYKGDHLFIGSFGFIPRPDDSAHFYNSYSIHIHVISLIAKYIDINPTYAPILNDLELTPGLTYDTDVRHGLLDFSVGYAHKFGGQ